MGYYSLKKPVDWGTSWYRLDSCHGTKITRPILAQIVGLADDFYQVSGPESLKECPQREDLRKEHLQSLEKNGLWAFTGILHIPQKGVYIQDNPNTHQGMPAMYENDLILKLAQGDPTVRFVSSDRIHSGEMNANDVRGNEYVIALAGTEGARKLSQIALQYRKLPWIAPPEHSTVASIYCGRVEIAPAGRIRNCC